jgi:exodeoxyribonuclease X
MMRGGGITNAVNTLVRPRKHIPPGASAIHHIVDEDLKDALALSEVIDRFRGADVYVAHNCEFESSFFAAQGIDLGPWICTYKCALRVWPELDGHSNQELRYALGRATPFPGFDHYLAAPRCFRRCGHRRHLRRADQEGALERLSAMVRRAALHTKFHFGKYRGRRYDEIAASDPDYLRWIIEKSELEAGIKHSARYWLTMLHRPEEPL